MHRRVMAVVVVLGLLAPLAGPSGAEEPSSGGPAGPGAGAPAFSPPPPTATGDRWSPAAAARPLPPDANVEEATSVVVKLAPGSSATAVARAAGGAVVESIPGTDYVVIDGAGRDAEELSRTLEARADVVSAQPNGVMRAFSPPNDPLYAQQAPALNQLRLEAGWVVETGSPDVIVAVLDSGVDPDHPDLAGRLVPGWNTITNSTATADDFGHGTMVSGIVAAGRGNGIGIAGVAGGGVKVMPVKVLDSFGAGSDADIAEGIYWAADHGADVINLSLGRLGSSDLVADAVAHARSKQVVVVAATGNEGFNAPSTPAGEPGVLGVAATDANGQFAWFSTFGYQVDLAAPGMGIWTTTDGGGYGQVDGTSFAAPMVAGVAALLRSRRPNYGEERIRIELTRTAEDRGTAGVDETYGFGVLDAAAALGVRGREPLLGVAPAALDVEPNDVPTRATTAAASNTGSLAVEGDVDWWSIPVVSASTISITLTPAAYSATRAANFDPVLVVHQADGSLVDTVDDAGTGEPESVTFTGEVGTNLIGISNWHGSTSAGTYQLTVTTTPTSGDFSWQPPTSAMVGKSTRVYLESTPGDYIGGGETFKYDQSSSSVTVMGAEFNLAVTLQGADQYWYVAFDFPQGQSGLEVGTFPNLARSSLHDPLIGGMSVTTANRGCNTLLGWIVVDDVVYDTDGLARFTLRFEQRCEEFMPPLHGWIRWNRDDPTVGSGSATNPLDPRTPTPGSAAPTDIARPVTSDTPPLVDFTGAPVTDSPTDGGAGTATIRISPTGPWMTDSSPAARALVSPDTPLSVSFGRPIEASSVNDTTVVLLDGVTGYYYPSTIEFLPWVNQVQIVPDYGVPSGSQLLLGVGGVQDTGGAYMPVTYVPFTTTGTAFTRPELGWDFDLLAGDFNGDGPTDAFLYQPGPDPDFTLLGAWEGFYGLETPVSGVYEPFTVDLDGDGLDDIVWYAPGPVPDYIWYGEVGGHTSTPTTINGDYEPFSLDLNGDGFEDILWYKPGTGADFIWYGKATGYTSTPTTVNGVYTPITMNLNGDAFDDIIWYAPGTGADFIWYGRASGWTSTPTTINGVYRPVSGDFNGDGFDDITWYTPGIGADFVWWGTATGFRSAPVTINGIYEPIAGDFNGDLFDDILFYGVGSAFDTIAFGGISGHLP